METDSPVYRGFLFLPNSGKIIKKTRQKRYCLLYKRSSSGVSRLEIYENESMTGQVKIVTLEDVIKITPKPSKVINVVTKNQDMEFGTLEETLVDWFEALKSVAFPEEIVTRHSSIEQDNDLYCSTDEGVFYVRLHPSEASLRCNLPSKLYILVVTTSALQLRNENDNTLLYTWPFSYIRRYGYKGGKFTFEAGRKCASGEGTFYLEHPNHNEIYRCLSTKMKLMRKLLNGESTSSLLDCGDFLQVLSMEAGSRNPLPPSSQSSFQDHSKSSLSLPLQSLNSSFESLSIVKPVPKKPPRKAMPLKSLSPSIVPLQEGKEYDSVEDRTFAWKTMGMPDNDYIEVPNDDNAPLKKCVSEAILTDKIGDKNMPRFGSAHALNFKRHLNAENDDRAPKNDEEMYASWGNFDVTKPEKSQAPTVIAEPNQSFDEMGYDHLNFFGQLTGIVTSPDYKQVNATSNPVPPLTESTHNLYEEVNVIEAARPADDSYLGYARIKKDSANGGHLKEMVDELATRVIETPKVAHQFENHQPYAIVSKAKRV